MAFEPQSKLLRTLVLSVNKQSAWGTAAVLADAALTRVQRFDGSAVIDRNPSRRSDAAMSGKGSHFATNGQVTMWDLKISGVKCELSDWLVGYVLVFCMGKDIVTGSTAPYTHAITFDESTRQCIPTTAYLKDSDDLTYKVPDLTVAKVTFTIPENGAIQVEFDFVGTGILVPGVMATLPAVPSETYLLGSDADFRMAIAGNATVSTLGRNRTTTLTLDYQPTPNRGTGSGLNANFIRRGSPKFSLSSTIAAISTDDVFTRLNNDTKMALQVVVNSGAQAQLTISIPSANFKTAKMGFEDDMTVWNIETDETTSYQAAGVAPITLTVINGVAAYATAAV